MRVRDPSEHKLAPARTAVRHGSLCLPQELPSHEASVDRSKCTRLLELLPGAPKPCPLPPPPAGMPLSSCMRYCALQTQAPAVLSCPSSIQYPASLFVALLLQVPHRP